MAKREAKINKPFMSIYECSPDDPGVDQSKKSTLSVRFTDFIHDDPSAKRKKKGEKKKEDKPYVIIGFDTEFKSPDEAVDKTDIKEGKAKYEVLSYQFHCKTNSGVSWSGVGCPDQDERITLTEFVVFALGTGIRDKVISKLPTTIYLVGHFTRADIPAFSDFKDLQGSTLR